VWLGPPIGLLGGFLGNIRAHLQNWEYHGGNSVHKRKKKEKERKDHPFPHPQPVLFIYMAQTNNKNTFDEWQTLKEIDSFMCPVLFFFDFCTFLLVVSSWHLLLCSVSPSFFFFFKLLGHRSLSSSWWILSQPWMATPMKDKPLLIGWRITTHRPALVKY
jgi:hypothetical protein